MPHRSEHAVRDVRYARRVDTVGIVSNTSCTCPAFDRY